MRKLTLILTFLLFVAFQASAQMTISGKVTNAESGEPIPGASVVVKGQTTIGTSTDMDGNYTLDGVPSDAETLVVSFVGMQEKEVAINGRTSIDVALAPSVQEMEEVVVTGYGTTRKKEFTGSMSDVSSAKLEGVQMESVDQLLQGNIAGLQSASVSGTPGAAQEIRIRGIGSIHGDNEPLVVIDGTPVVSGEQSRISTSSNILSSLDPNQIEDVTVLKDAGATAIYGARGSNGVIVITTKSGKSGKTKFNFNAEYGYNDLAVGSPDALNAEQLQELRVEGLENTYGFSDPADFNAMVGFEYLPIWDGETDTDWTEEVLRDVARQQEYDLSASGGSENTTFFVSGGYSEKEGKVDATGFERFSGRAKFEHRPIEDITIKLNTNASYSEQNTVAQGGSFRNPMMSRHFLLPFDPVKDENGDYWWNPATGRMSNSLFNTPYIQKHDFADTKTTKVVGSTLLEWRPIDGLKLSSRLNLDYFGIEEPEYWNPTHGDGASYQGLAWAYYTRNFNWVSQNMADYGFNVDDHRFDFKLVYESQKNKRYTISANAERVASMGLTNLASFASPQTASSAETDWGSASGMFNMRYGFRNTYFFEGTYRREGHSRFSDENKYGNFWSVGGSWTLSNESFLQGIDALNNLKLRSSYGLNGNAGLPGARLYQAEFGFSDSYNDYPVINYSGTENQDLTWEITKKFNVGLDYELFDSRLSGTIEYFDEETEDMLLSLPLSRTKGFSSEWANVGSMNNSGIEASLTTVNFDGNGFDSFRWTTDFNISKINNEVTGLARGKEEIIEGTKRIMVGNHVKTYYMRKWAGVDPENGDPLWYVDGKGGETTNVYSEAERADQGNSLPDVTGGLTNTLSYGGVSLSFQFNFSFAYQVYDSWANYMMSDGRNNFSYNQYAGAMDRWQEPGDNAENPKIMMGGNKKSYETSTRYLKNADHVRLRSLSLSYELPQSLLENYNIDKLSLFLRGTNIWTYVFNDNLEWEPETDATGIIDMEAPVLETYTVGAKLSF